MKLSDEIRYMIQDYEDETCHMPDAIYLGAITLGELAIEVERTSLLIRAKDGLEFDGIPVLVVNTNYHIGVGKVSPRQEP